MKEITNCIIRVSIGEGASLVDRQSDPARSKLIATDDFTTNSYILIFSWRVKGTYLIPESYTDCI